MTEPRHTRPPQRWELVLYSTVRGLLVTFARVWLRASVTDASKVPTEGAFIVAPVHRSNLDFMLVLLTTRRRIRFLGKDSLFVGFWDHLFRALGGIPVARGTADREALKTCIEVLEAGEPLVIFPEGTRQEGPVVGELFDGAAFVQSRTGVPIVPIGIGGSQAAMPRGARMVRPRRVCLIVGEPMRAPTIEGARARRHAIRETTAALRTVIQELFDRAQAQAGTPNR